MPVDACLIQVAFDPTKYIISGAALVVAAASVVAMKKIRTSNKGKMALIYLHLTALFFPVAVFATNEACGIMCLPCFESPAAIALLAIPSAMSFSAIAGFAVIPGYFFLSSRTVRIRDRSMLHLVSRHSRRLKIRPPRLVAVNSSRPFAFSFRTFRSAIVLSVGLTDILNKRELEAVLLHELAHIRNRASIFKLSAFLMRFSPMGIFKSFSIELDREEAEADRFVCGIQNTDRNLLSAREKICDYKGSIE